MTRFSVRVNEGEASSSQHRPRKLPRIDPLPRPLILPPSPLAAASPGPQRSPSFTLSSDSEAAAEEEEGDEMISEQEDDEGEEDGQYESDDDIYCDSQELESNGNEDDEVGRAPEEEAAVTQERIGSPDCNKDESVDAIITDPDVLDCNVCLEPLSAPIFQCENGHIACASCCVKIKNKCHLCSWPIGYNRCRAIEKVLESVKVKCKYARYGCQAFLRYDKKQDHENQCNFVSCLCPFSCSFAGSVAQLSQHFSDKHSAYRSTFKLHEVGDFYLKDDTKFHILQGQLENFLFVLTNRNAVLGNVITITRIGPPSFQNYQYSLSIKHQGSTLKLKTYTTTTRNIVTVPIRQRFGYNPTPQTPFLLVPKEFFSGNLGLKISFCILNRLKPS